MRLQNCLANCRFTKKIYYSFLNNYVAKKQYRKNKKLLNNLKQFKNIHSGKRCFIIGTGPSLRIEDLELLKNEITFASNRIYEIFSKTDWRPTYYMNQDMMLIDKFSEEIINTQAKHKFLPLDRKDIFINQDNVSFFVLKHKDFYPKDAEFSHKVDKFIGQGFTVTYGAIQLAAYMGFSEIYLLGVDHNYSISLDEKGVPVFNNDVKDYFKGSKASNKDLNLPRIAESTLAYMTAQKVSKKCNEFKIYNATRGGKLEAFPRVVFDDLF